MKDYSKVDAAILQSIADRPSTLSGLSTQAWQEAHAVNADCGAMRVLDKRLQALRKKGAIHFNRKWKLGAKP